MNINMHSMSGGSGDKQRSQSEIDADKEAWAKKWAEINAKHPHILVGRNIHKNKRKGKQKRP